MEAKKQNNKYNFRKLKIKKFEKIPDITPDIPIKDPKTSLTLISRIEDLSKEYERNRENIKDLEKRQTIIEYELQAFRTLARDLLAHGIEDIRL